MENWTFWECPLYFHEKFVKQIVIEFPKLYKKNVFEINNTNIISALLGTVLCFLIMFLISYKYASLSVGRLLLIDIIYILLWNTSCYDIG